MYTVEIDDGATTQSFIVSEFTYCKNEYDNNMKLELRTPADDCYVWVGGIHLVKLTSNAIIFEMVEMRSGTGKLPKSRKITLSRYQSFLHRLVDKLTT